MSDPNSVISFPDARGGAGGLGRLPAPPRGPSFRRYERLPGRPVSVTSLLRHVFPQPELDTWKIEEAVRLGREFPDEPAEGILDRHRSAAQRGQRVHRWIESTLRGEPAPVLPMEPERAMARHWVEWWATRDLMVESVEQTVMGEGYAGTLDLLAYDRPEHDRFEPLVVVDWKTTRQLPAAPYPEHLAQLAAYGLAVEEGELVDDDGVCQRMGTTVHYGIVVYVSPEGVREFVVADSDWIHAIDLWGCTLAMARCLWGASIGT